MGVVFDQALEWLAEQPAFTIVQIGAFTGDTPNDPLYGFLAEQLPAHPDAIVILVEPVKDYFTQLQATYAEFPQVICENVAVAEVSGERDFYRLDVDPVEHGQTNYWAQLGSLREERLTTLWEHGQPPSLQERVIERVRCVTLHGLLASHQLTQVDLLEIDTEGYDYEILRTIDFVQFRPRFINYERRLLYEDEPACRELMTRAGYRLADWPGACSSPPPANVINDDTFCVRSDA